MIPTDIALILATWVLIAVLRYKDKQDRVHEKEEMQFFLAAMASMDAQKEVR